jgi:hypothetical protein
MTIPFSNVRYAAHAAALLLAACCSSALAGEDVPLQGEAYRLADRAYRELAAGHVDRAAAAAGSALRLRPDSRQLGLLLLDIQLRKGDLAAARRQADALLERFPHDALVLVQRGYLAQREQRHQAAMEDFYAALSQPQGLDAQQQRSARLGWADSALATKQYSVVLDALAPYAREQDATVQLALAYAYVGLNRREQAHAAAQLAQQAGGNAGQRAVARALLAQTAAPVPGDLDQAYAALRDKDDRAALAAFQRAFAAKAGTAGQYADAAYAAKRLGDNATASALFRQALAANAHLPAGQRAFGEQLQYGYRREIEQMNRNYGVVASAAYQSSGFTPQDNVNVLQGGLEAYWQPEDGGYRDGRIFQLFARGYETLYDKSGGATGSRTAQGSVGARYKPLGDANVVLTAERLFRVGNLAYSDWLMRVGYSTGDGLDLQPSSRDWSAWQFYTEGAYFVSAGRYIQSLEGRYGHSWRMDDMGGRLVLTPHLAVLGNYDNRALHPAAVGIGPGLNVRYWFREDAYQAPTSWFDVTVQYMKELTQTRREQGLMLRTTLWY